MIAAAPPLMAAPDGIRAVTLSSGGLAEVTLVHAVDGDTTIGLNVRPEQIDDILKSLVVRDPLGTVGACVWTGWIRSTRRCGRCRSPRTI